MKNFLFSILFIGCFISDIYAQEDYNKGSFLDFKVGKGLDGTGYSINLEKTDLPTIGLGYQYKFNKYFALGGEVVSFYRKQIEITNTFFGRFEYDNLIFRDSETIFVNQEERDKITNVGIKDLNPYYSVKVLQVPITLKTYFYPIHIKNHHLGLAIGVTGIFGSYKWHRDGWGGTRIVFEDNSEISELAFAQETEFRNFNIGGGYFGITYEYSYRKNIFGVSLASYDQIWSQSNTLGMLNLAVVFKFKI